MLLHRWGILLGVALKWHLNAEDMSSKRITQTIREIPYISIPGGKAERVKHGVKMTGLSMWY